ncbi:hypothetical protein [Salinicola peritrichatus]|uniref:hypothetical protein n=1 Tax=Salinicola peritrichatus TaxID=1267424 RepID=UPI000DA1E907|nr:hypothetical protein [Salinicola peritrichatus]
MIITVGDFKRMLDEFDDQLELSFSGLEYHRISQTGDKLVQVEFEEKVFKDKTGHIQVHSEKH